MIIKSFEFNKTNLDKYNFFLFYGENNGFKQELIQTVIDKKKAEKTTQEEVNCITSILQDSNILLEAIKLGLSAYLFSK